VTPSQEDRALTTRLREAGELLGITLLDHLILGEGCYSFADQGWP
jgi:DNA repair protein RadC